ncbi:hypothetical protein [Vibrio echinoideorum]|uniref:hypothetical protein n=1 Tax=Vibrio echinoideorum TaxID=2100116 RepID=UPI003550C660
MLTSIYSLINNILKFIYFRSGEGQLSQLNQLELTKPKLYKPSADGERLLLWNKIFNPYFSNIGFDEIKKQLSLVVQATTQSEDDFDFGLIDSLNVSKSFGMGPYKIINGSWFRDVAQWGEGMYPYINDNRSLSGLDEDDWKSNLAHIKQEGFNSKELLIYYYDWLDRYEGLNTGGSHHAAMLIHQIRNQKFSYTRNACVTRWSIDVAPIARLLENGYYAFVTGGKSYFAPYGSCSYQVDTLIRDLISKDVFELTMGSCSPNHSKIIIFHKSDLIVSHSAFTTWYERQVKLKKIIPLLNLLECSKDYCTTPYLHELDAIYLGDPYRTADLELRKLKRGGGNPLS